MSLKWITKQPNPDDPTDTGFVSIQWDRPNKKRLGHYFEFSSEYFKELGLDTIQAQALLEFGNNCIEQFNKEKYESKTKMP